MPCCWIYRHTQDAAIVFVIAPVAFVSFLQGDDVSVSHALCDFVFSEYRFSYSMVWDDGGLTTFQPSAGMLSFLGVLPGASKSRAS